VDRESGVKLPNKHVLHVLGIPSLYICGMSYSTSFNTRVLVQLKNEITSNLEGDSSPLTGPLSIRYLSTCRDEHSAWIYSTTTKELDLSV